MLLVRALAHDLVQRRSKRQHSIGLRHRVSGVLVRPDGDASNETRVVVRLKTVPLDEPTLTLAVLGHGVEQLPGVHSLSGLGNHQGDADVWHRRIRFPPINGARAAVATMIANA